MRVAEIPRHYSPLGLLLLVASNSANNGVLLAFDAVARTLNVALGLGSVGLGLA